MNAGILLLRLLLSLLLAGHAGQKLFGWFDGHGITGTAPLFDRWGLRPAKLMVTVAGISELAGAVLMSTGTFTAVGVAFVVGTMLVAASVNSSNGFWAIRGGYELPLVYGVLGFGIGLVGPGRYSVDAHTDLLRFAGPGYVVFAAAAAVVGATPLIARITVTRRTESAALAPPVAKPADHLRTA